MAQQSELQSVTKSLEKSDASYGMKISHGKINDDGYEPNMKSSSRMLKTSNGSQKLFTKCNTSSLK